MSNEHREEFFFWHVKLLEALLEFEYWFTKIDRYVVICDDYVLMESIFDSHPVDVLSSLYLEYSFPFTKSTKSTAQFIK